MTEKGLSPCMTIWLPYYSIQYTGGAPSSNQRVNWYGTVNCLCNKQEILQISSYNWQPEMNSTEKVRTPWYTHRFEEKKYSRNFSCPSSVADPDPGSGAFLTPGSGIRDRFFRIPDLGSQIHIFESLVTIFWVKSSIILWKLAQIFFFITSKLNLFAILWNLWLHKKLWQQIFFTPLFCCCFWIRDPRSGIRDGWKSGSGIRDKHPGSATLCPSYKRSLRPQKRTSAQFKKWNLWSLWVIVVLLDPDCKSRSGSGSGSRDPIESGSDKDTDPDPQHCFQILVYHMFCNMCNIPNLKRKGRWRYICVYI